MELLNEIINTQEKHLTEAKSIDGYAIVNASGSMINPTAYGYEVGFRKEWVYDRNDYKQIVDTIEYLNSQNWTKTPFTIVETSSIGENIF